MKISLHRHSFKASVFVSLWLIGVIFVNLLSIADSEGKGGVEKRSYYFKEADKEIDYRLYVPSGYSKGKKFPLIVLLHGLGSNPQQVIRYEGIIQEAEKRNYIVVAPYGYNERGWYGARGKGKQGTIEALLLGEESQPYGMMRKWQMNLLIRLGNTCQNNQKKNPSFFTFHLRTYTCLGLLILGSKAKQN